MKARIFRTAWILVALMVLTPPLLIMDTITARTDASRNGQTQEPRRPKTRQRLEMAEGSSLMPRRPAGQLGWALEPRIFEMLSSGGRRAALLMNGLVPSSAKASSQISVESRQYPQTVPFQNVMVDNPASDVDGHTHSETSIAVSGPNIVEAFNDADFGSGSGYAYSTDSGNSWAAKRIPTPSNGANAGDPVVAFGPAGELYYSDISYTFGRAGPQALIGICKSTDNGASFSVPVNASTTASNARDLQDKPWIAVDKWAASQFKGRVYVSWTTFTQQGGFVFINFARSTDGGATFGDPIAVTPRSPRFPATGSMPVVAPNGDVYVVYSDFSLTPGGISIVKSTDGGQTFSQPKIVSTFFRIETVTGGNTVRVNSFPRITVDPNGSLHIVYNAITHFLGPDRSDIYYVRSTDGGNTFSPAMLLNDDGSQTTQFFPCIAAAADGTLGVRWWDRRNDPINDSLTDVYMTVSHDGGATWSKNFRISDHNWVFGPEEFDLSAGYHGDYDDIAADGTNFYISWSDERAAFPNAYFAFIPINQNPALPDFNLSTTRVYDSVIAGNSIEFDLNTNSVNGFTGSLSLSVATPPPGGITFNFASSSVSPGTQAKLTVSTSTSAQPGTYLMTVQAAGGGLTRRTNFRLTVYDPSRIASNVFNVTKTPGFSFIQDGLQIDAGGIVHLAFDDDTAVAAGGSDVLYSRSTDGGNSFSNPIKISTNSPFSRNSTLTLDASGAVYISWTSVDQTTGNGRIMVSRSTDHGLTFSTPVLASLPSQDSDLSRLAVDRTGNILPVYFVDPGSNTPSLFAARSTNGGTSFSDPVQVSGKSEAVSTTGQSVAFDSGGTAYVVYSDFAANPPAIRFATASDGQHFAASSIISDGRNSDFAPDIAISGNGTIYVAFYSRVADLFFGTVRNVELIKSCDKGSTFSGQVTISEGGGENVLPLPSIVVDNNGAISIAWTDDIDNDQGDIFYSRSTDGGATFASPQNLSSNSGQSFGAVAALDPSGKVFIAWTDDSTADTDVLMATLPPAAVPLVPAGFGLVFNPGQITVSGGDKGTIDVFISRMGGFSGNVTVSPVNAASIKMKLKPGSASTSCLSASFSFKVKGNAPAGLHTLTFNGIDDRGNSQTGNLIVNIQ